MLDRFNDDIEWSYDTNQEHTGWYYSNSGSEHEINFAKHNVNSQLYLHLVVALEYTHAIFQLLRLSTILIMEVRS